MTGGGIVKLVLPSATDHQPSKIVPFAIALSKYSIEYLAHSYSIQLIEHVCIFQYC